jgi:hypothetical protein
MTDGNARICKMERVADKDAYALHGTLLRDINWRQPD